MINLIALTPLLENKKSKLLSLQEKTNSLN